MKDDAAGRADDSAVDVGAILDALGPEFDDPGDDPWGGANLADVVLTAGGVYAPVDLDDYEPGEFLLMQVCGADGEVRTAYLTVPEDGSVCGGKKAAHG